MCSCFHPSRQWCRRSFRSLATGAVPVVADFGGPGDIVHPEVGYKVPLTNENDIVAQMEKILTELAHNRDRLKQLRRARNSLCAGMPNLGCEGTEHNSGPELGCAARPETRSPAAKDAALRVHADSTTAGLDPNESA